MMQTFGLGHKRSRSTANFGAEAIQVNTITHCLYMRFPETGCSAMITGICALVAGSNAGVVVFLCHSLQVFGNSITPRIGDCSLSPNLLQTQTTVASGLALIQYNFKHDEIYIHVFINNKLIRFWEPYGSRLIIFLFSQ